MLSVVDIVPEADVEALAARLLVELESVMVELALNDDSTLELVVVVDASDKVELAEEARKLEVVLVGEVNVASTSELAAAVVVEEPGLEVDADETVLDDSLVVVSTLVVVELSTVVVCDSDVDDTAELDVVTGVDVETCVKPREDELCNVEVVATVVVVLAVVSASLVLVDVLSGLVAVVPVLVPVDSTLAVLEVVVEFVELFASTYPEPCWLCVSFEP